MNVFLDYYKAKANDWDMTNNGGRTYREQEENAFQEIRPLQDWERALDRIGDRMDRNRVHPPRNPHIRRIP